jgi:hypothetical protein
MVFYVSDHGLHGLIVDTVDLSTAMRWYAGTNVNTMAYAGSMAGTYVGGVGGGRANTAIIIASQGYGDGNTYAARVCNEYTIDWNNIYYDDWYLPSYDELLLMSNTVGNGATGNYHNLGGFNNGYYWSSTEHSASGAYYWAPGGSAGGWISNDKVTTYSVRAIRAF